MKRFLILILVIMSSELSIAQFSKTEQKWINATFGIDVEFFDRGSEVGGGTSVFLEHKGRYYLLTARHVIQNKEKDTVDTRPVKKILLRQNIESITNKRASLVSEEIFNLSENQNFAWGSIDEDVAIVDLNVVYPTFLKSLKDRGYIPITLADIDTLGTAKVGDNVFKVGYPMRVTYEYDKAQDPQYTNAWNGPTYAAIPNLTRGVISEYSKGGNEFSAYIMNIWGFSGSALVEKSGKMIGITSGIITTIHSRQSEWVYGSLHAGEVKPVYVKVGKVPELIRRLEANAH